MKATTSQNYRQRLTRVIDYIHDNLDTTLEVNELANIATMSPYHFHRIYRLMTHETVNATVRRLRLQQAAVQLIRSNQPVSEIATQLTYGSVAAFSRAFNKEFGELPSSYRRTHRDKKSVEQTSYAAMLPVERTSHQETYNVEIIEFDEVHLAAYSHQGDYMKIGVAFEQLTIYASSIGVADHGLASYGLYYDDPASTKIEELRAHACINIDLNLELSGDNPPQRITIPKGRYATLLFKGPYAELDDPYNWLFGEWLPNSGYDAGDFPPIEQYLNNARDTPANELLTRIHCLLLS